MLTASHTGGTQCSAAGTLQPHKTQLARSCVVHSTWAPLSFRHTAGRPFTARRPLRLCRAADSDEQQETDSAAGSESGVPPPRDPARAAARAAEEAEVAKGQRTAVITGAVSIVFGVLYLVLVQLLDSRGGELLPPPPEAFGL